MYIKKDRVHLSGSSPRDHQRRHTSTVSSVDVVLSLMNKVDVLTHELNSVKSSMVAPTTIDNGDVLISKIEMLEKLLQSKEDTIKALQNNSSGNSVITEEIVSDVDKNTRPSIVREVIDPTVEASHLEPFIQTKHESPKSVETKTDILNKVNKLRSIMGGS